MILPTTTEVFPSNNLELGLWMESERMLHLLNEVGVETQNEVVKEEKRLPLRQFTLRQMGF